MRILVVDDEPLIASALADVLSCEGHQVATAINGSAALRKLRERAYDLILSDMRMPELDGPGLYRQLKRWRPDSIKRIVFMTGSPDDPASAMFLRQTGVPYLRKPFDLEDLQQVTERLLLTK